MWLCTSISTISCITHSLLAISDGSGLLRAGDVGFGAFRDEGYGDGAEYGWIWKIYRRACAVRVIVKSPRCSGTDSDRLDADELLNC